jgi:hypothetical protein
MSIHSWFISRGLFDTLYRECTIINFDVTPMVSLYVNSLLVSSPKVIQNTSYIACTIINFDVAPMAYAIF